VFDSHAARTGSGPTFVPAKKYEKLTQERHDKLAKEKTQIPNQGKWRRDHEDFVNACRAGRGEDVPSPVRTSNGYNNGKVNCPHCDRQFDKTAADRHIPICANVRNRPKPPPSPGLSAPPPRVGNGGNDATLLVPNAPRQRRGGPLGGPSASPSRGSHESSVPELPSMDRTDRTMRSGSPGSSRASNASMNSSASAGFGNGNGLRAARSLKQLNSTDKLPGLDTPPRAPGARGATPNRQRGSSQPAEENGRSRMQAQLGAQRSALMHRLLRQVPLEALRQELSDAGVTSDGLDKEACVKAMVQQLV
ncbi:unnamed protein product, partial [Polarella glacialis]